MSKPEPAAPMTRKTHAEWFHGSPQKLKTLLAGSTVTPVLELAKAFAHKPSCVEIQVRENTDRGQRHITIAHNGDKPGHLYRVVLEDATRDLTQHPGSDGAPGEEILTTRELPLEYLQPLTVASTYEFLEELIPDD